MTSGESIVCEQVDTIVSCYAAVANPECDWIEARPGMAVTRIGDALAPRTVEEAVLEAWQLARSL